MQKSSSPLSQEVLGCNQSRVAKINTVHNLDRAHKLITNNHSFEHTQSHDGMDTWLGIIAL